MSSIRSDEVVIFDAALLAERDHWLEKFRSESWTTGLETWAKGSGAGWSRLHTTLDAELCQNLMRVSSGSDFLLYTVTLAGLALVLSRRSGQQRISIAAPALLGERSNLAPALIAVDSHLTSKQFLNSTRQALLDVYQNQSYPFHYLLRNLGYTEGEQTPLDVTMELAGFHESKPDFGAALSIRLERVGQEISAVLVYDAARVHEDDAERLISGWRQAMREILTRPESKLLDLGLCGVEETSQILKWSGNGIAPGEFKPLHQLLASQAAQSPDAIAIIFGDQWITYRELEARASRLAGYFLRQNVNAGDMIGVLMRRSPDLVAAIWAALKIGAAFLPLDADDPADRIAFMLDAAAATLVIADPKLADRIDPQAIKVIACENALAAVEKETPFFCDAPVSPDSLAYVIYTSGSTGRPKGVMVTQAGAENYLQWCLDAYRRSEAIHSILHTPVSFDLSITSVFPALLSGGSIMLAPEGVEAVLESLEPSSCFGALKLTPSHLTILNHALRAGRLQPLWGDLIVGGEALLHAVVAEFRSYCPGARVFNEYGPTEATVGCCVEEVIAQEEVDSPTVSIGRPIPGARLYILGEGMQLSPSGIPGEIYIGGGGVARGYAKRPALTADLFLPDLYGAEPGGRMYRTGDHGVYRPDGRIDFLGRTDQQVKIRGHRIELSEIEYALRQHPDVMEAAVLTRIEARGSEQLIAFCAVRREGEEGLSEWRAFLGERLPDYMIPSTLLTVAEIPRTSRGKIDRSVLLAVEQKARQAARPGQGPRNPIESALTEIWAELLERNNINIDDNFFELGGHSLFATQALSRMKKRFEIDLPLRVIFETPTIAGLAAVISAKLQAKELSNDGGKTILRRARGNSASTLLKAGDLTEEEVRTLLGTISH